MPALERLVQFTTARHRLLTHNIANLSTPYFKPVDLDPQSFQAAMREAIDKRRKQPAPLSGPLEIRSTRQLRFEPDGLQVKPSPRNENILFHDQNNRDLERLMQDLAENTMAHNAGIQLLASEFDMLKLAIRERI